MCFISNWNLKRSYCMRKHSMRTWGARAHADAIPMIAIVCLWLQRISIGRRSDIAKPMLLHVNGLINDKAIYIVCVDLSIVSRKWRIDGNWISLDAVCHALIECNRIQLCERFIYGAMNVMHFQSNFTSILATSSVSGPTIVDCGKSIRLWPLANKERKTRNGVPLKQDIK